MNRGSTWHIWDFHLHTPYSILNNQFGDPDNDATWERYITAIETKAAETGIVAIGITDYFTIEGYKRVRQYQEDGRLQNLLIFPNIEFRVDTIIERRRLNYHVLFSPDVPVNHIEEYFLHDLNFVHENQPFQSPHIRKLRLSNLEEFGNTLRQQHESFRSRPPFEIGCMNAKVKLDDIKRRLEEDGRFSGKYLLILAEENLSLMNWDGQDHATRKQLLQMSHAIFSSNGRMRRFCLGEYHESKEDYIAEFKSFKPCIWGCDSHGFEERFLEPDEGRYCWIKSDVSWEGLKQILYEPEDRVRIQPDDPEPSKSFFTLDSVQVESTQINDMLRIADLDIKLNHNLVAIIGGRGSGKTALLDLIAACFTEGEKLTQLEHSFYHRLYASGGGHGANSQPIPISLRFRSDDEFSKQVGNDSIVFESADILYLTQNHLDEYTANPANLYGHIVDIVFDQNPDQRQGYDALQEQAQELQRRIESLNLEIAQLRQQVKSSLSEEQKERVQKQGELSDYENRLQEQEAQQAGSGEETVQLTEHLKSLKARRDRIITLRERLSVVSEHITQFHEQYKLDAQAVNEQLQALSELSNLSSLPIEFSQLDTVTQLLSTNVETLQLAQPDVEEQITGVESELGELKGIDRTIAELRRTINNITGEIEAINARIKDLREKEQRILELDAQCVEKFTEMIQKMIEQRLYLQEIIDEFETDQDDLLSGLSFAALVDTSIRKEYIERIVDKMDKRAHPFASVEQALTEIIEDAHQQLNSSEHPNELDDTSAVLPIAQRLRDWANGDIRLKTSTVESEFFNALFSRFFRIGLLIKFNDRPLESLSMGERAVVLLKILLGLDDKPLLIDQPEEHLDNRYIYNELTPAFRNAKAKRQIIIATHNANLVVNTDAEQIIIAEHTDGVISYRVGTLENLDIRESITTILEGGDQAFKKREEKYGYLF
ncbi:MAG TPA: hypothetical protein EYH05_11270 [Anaerolineae bacterium]|nr:hypothetical protein [Anaerolineae bacterium]